jgi:hypothetical protein
LFGGLFREIREIFEEDVVKECFQRFGEARQAFLRLTGADQFLIIKDLDILFISEILTKCGDWHIL